MKTYITKIITAATDVSVIKKEVEDWVNSNKVEGASIVHLDYSNSILIGGYVNKKETKKKK